MSRNVIIGLCVVGAFGLGGALGRFAVPTKETFKDRVVETVATQKVIDAVTAKLSELDAKRDTTRQIVTTRKPDGTVTRRERDTSHAETKQVASQQTETKGAQATQTSVDHTTEHIIEHDRARYRVGALAATTFRLGPISYGAYGDIRLLGPVWVGAFGDTSGRVGLSLGVEF